MYVRFMSTGMLLEQLRADEDHRAAELIEVLHHCVAVSASADFRMLQAVSLIHDEYEEDYLATVAAAVGSGEATPQTISATAMLGRAGDDPRGRYGPNGLEKTIAEIGAALTVTPARARELIVAGSVMRNQLPFVGGMLAIGRIDLPRFLMVVKRSELVDQEKMGSLDTALVGEIENRGPMSMTRFLTMLDATIARTDAGATRRRREVVAKDRAITVRSDRHTPGQARMSATLPAEHAAAVNARLDAMAADVHDEDPRTRAQRRLDGLVALAGGHTVLECRCQDCLSGTPDTADGTVAQPDASDQPEEAAAPRTDSCDASSAQPRDGAPRPTFHIVVNLSTLLARDDDPAFLDGHGVIDAATARALLTEAHRSYVHTDHGNTDDHRHGDHGHKGKDKDDRWHNPAHARRARAERRYKPGRKLAELIRCGELCCTFPGCTNPVWRADLDHTTPHGKASGRTNRRNLKPLCRFHHRFKTFDPGWRDYQDEMGTVFFQSPDGHMYLGNAYTGRDLFTSLAPPEQPADQLARRRIDQIRSRRAESAKRADKREIDRWNAENPPPF
ncbi:HNH endonuclease signature motif containing protein [Gordonia hankookensis]